MGYLSTRRGDICAIIRSNMRTGNTVSRVTVVVILIQIRAATGIIIDTLASRQLRRRECTALRWIKNTVRIIGRFFHLTSQDYRTYRRVLLKGSASNNAIQGNDETHDAKRSFHSFIRLNHRRALNTPRWEKNNRCPFLFTGFYGHLLISKM